jgi:hypothetical protein
VLAATLGEVAAVMQVTRDPWWVIGSAAVALHGGYPVEVADVDVLCSANDARAVIHRLRLAQITSVSDLLFHSGVFARWDMSPLAVELMADFHVRREGAWRRVWPVTRELLTLDVGVVAVPSRAELRELLLTFGREKDLLKARLLA